MSFVTNRGQYDVTGLAPCAQRRTTLHIALTGPGFFGVNSTTNGQYTRAGDFQMDGDGVLRTTTGDLVSAQGGGNITIPQGSTEIKIDEQGRVSNQNGEIGQIMIVEFTDVQQIKPLGNNTYASDAAGVEAEKTVAKQGFWNVNVKPVLEMSRMIEASRTFQQVQNSLQGEHERLRKAIQTLIGQSG